MKTITVLSLKPGSGRTTVCLSLALAARQAGLKAVVADLARTPPAQHPDTDSLVVQTEPDKLKRLQGACRANGCDLLIIDTPVAPSAHIRRAAGLADLLLVVTRPGLVYLAAAIDTCRLARSCGVEAQVLFNDCKGRRGRRGPGIVPRTILRLFGGLPMSRVSLGRRPTYHQVFADQDGVSVTRPWEAFATDVTRLLNETAADVLWAQGPQSAPALPPTGPTSVAAPSALALGARSEGDGVPLPPVEPRPQDPFSIPTRAFAQATHRDERTATA